MIEIRLQQQKGRGAGHRLENVIPRLLPRLFRRDRVLLRDDVFDREAFADLVGRLAGWKG
jgi:hypothetical protein